MNTLPATTVQPGEHWDEVTEALILKGWAPYLVYQPLMRMWDWNEYERREVL